MFQVPQLSDEQEALIKHSHILSNIAQAIGIRSDLSSHEYTGEANKLTIYINELLDKLGKAK